MSGKKQKRSLVSAEVASLLLQNNLSRGTIKYLSESISHTIVTLAEMNIQGYAGVDMYQMSRENYGGSEATGRYDVNRHGVKSLGHFFDDIKSLKTVSNDVESKARCLRWLGFHMLYAYTAIHIFGEERDRESLLDELFQHDFDYETHAVPAGENTIGLFRVMMEQDSDDVYKKLPPNLTPYDKSNLIRKVIQLIENEEEICALRYKLEIGQFKISDNAPYTGTSVRKRRLENESKKGEDSTLEEVSELNATSSFSSSSEKINEEMNASSSAKKKMKDIISISSNTQSDSVNPLFLLAQSAELSVRIRESLSIFLEDQWTMRKKQKLNYQYHMNVNPNDDSSSRLMSKSLRHLVKNYAVKNPDLNISHLSYSSIISGADFEDEFTVEAEHEDFHLNIHPNMDHDELLLYALQKLQQGAALMYKTFSV